MFPLAFFFLHSTRKQVGAWQFRANDNPRDASRAVNNVSDIPKSPGMFVNNIAAQMKRETPQRKLIRFESETIDASSTVRRP